MTAETSLKSCNFTYQETIGATVPDREFAKEMVKIKKRILKFGLMCARKVPVVKSLPLFAPRKKRAYPLSSIAFQPQESLNLTPGEWVEVRSREEIFATLDENGKYRGLLFMPEMEKFCGRKFRVYKRVGKIMLESTIELRKLVSPTVFLEGSYCDGEFHEWCDRSCFCFWREAWLKRVQ